MSLNTLNYNPLVSPYETGEQLGDPSGSGNQAIEANFGIGGLADLSISIRGSDWYYTVCAVMGASTLAFMGLAFTKPRHDRIFHYITALITLVAAIAYFSMGSNLGQTPIIVEFWRPSSARTGGATFIDRNGNAVPGTREIFWVRYVDWFVTTPLLLLDLLLTAGVPWPTVLATILADEVMIVSGLVGALTRSTYKWGFWTFGTVAMFYVFYSLAIVGRQQARLNPISDVARVFNICGVLTLVLWLLYPIAWGVSEGGNILHPDSEAIFYGVLDLFAKPVFGFMLIFGHKNITAADLGLPIGGHGQAVSEKNAGYSNGYHNGVTAPPTGTTAAPAAGPTTVPPAVQGSAPATTV